MVQSEKKRTLRRNITYKDMVKIQGDISRDQPDSGKPVKIGGIGRTTNPTAVTDGDRVGLFSDILGRIVTVFQQVRDLVTVNNITLTTGVETTLLAGVSGVFLDLVTVSGANTSTAGSIRVDFRDTTGGTVRFSLEIPAGNTVEKTFHVPYPQGAVNTNWTAQMEDISSENVRVFAQAVRNV